MKKKRWVYLGVALLVLVPLAAQQGNMLQPRNSVTVHDSKGKTVGGLIDRSTFPGAGRPLPTVAFKAGQQLVILGVKPDHFVGTEGLVYFATNDCSGTPYFDSTGLPSPDWPSLIARTFVANDGTVYATMPGSTISPVSLGSVIYQEDGFPGAPICNSNPAPDTPVLDGQVVGNVGSMYTPPFVLR